MSLDPDTIRVGRWYWLEGAGPMKVMVLPAPPAKTSFTCRSPDGIFYYAAEGQFARECGSPVRVRRSDGFEHWADPKYVPPGSRVVRRVTWDKGNEE